MRRVVRAELTARDPPTQGPQSPPGPVTTQEGDDSTGDRSPGHGQATVQGPGDTGVAVLGAASGRVRTAPTSLAVPAQAPVDTTAVILSL